MCSPCIQLELVITDGWQVCWVLYCNQTTVSVRSRIGLPKETSMCPNMQSLTADDTSNIINASSVVMQGDVDNALRVLSQYCQLFPDNDLVLKNETWRISAFTWDFTVWYLLDLRYAGMHLSVPILDEQTEKSKHCTHDQSSGSNLVIDDVQKSQLLLIVVIHIHWVPSSLVTRRKNCSSCTQNGFAMMFSPDLLYCQLCLFEFSDYYMVLFLRWMKN